MTLSRYQQRGQQAKRRAYPRRAEQGLPPRDRGETQRALLEFIIDYKTAHDGNCPTYRTIAENLGISVPSAYVTAQRLVVKGVLRINEQRELILGTGGNYSPPQDFPPERL